MGASDDLRASLAALAARDPEQPGFVYFHEHEMRWRWHSWHTLEEAVSAAGARAASEPAPPDGEAAPWPSIESLVLALARPGLDEAAARAAALPSLATASGRPIALLASEPLAGEPRAWLACALAWGAALVLPAAPELLAWSVAWTRPTHLGLAAADLAELRDGLLLLEKPRALRRRLRRLRHLLVWGGEPGEAEAAAWAELGVALSRWPAG